MGHKKSHPHLHQQRSQDYCVQVAKGQDIMEAVHGVVYENLCQAVRHQKQCYDKKCTVHFNQLNQLDAVPKYSGGKIFKDYHQVR